MKGFKYTEHNTLRGIYLDLGVYKNSAIAPIIIGPVQMKLEIANELGMSNYQQMDKGNLTARQNGYVGGYMTKKLVEMAEQQMAGKQQ